MKISRTTLLFVILVLIVSPLVQDSGPVQAASRPIIQQEQNQFCYAVADAGGGPPGDDLLTLINVDTREEVAIGSPGTFNIEAITFSLEKSTMFAADAGQLGTLDLETGLFTPHPEPFGVGRGEVGDILINDVDGLAIDPLTGILYGTHRRADLLMVNDLLVQIDQDTGRIIQDAYGEGIDYVVIQAGEVTDRYHIDDIAFDPETNEMFAINNFRGRNDLLVVIDPATGAIARVIADLGIVNGLGLEDMEGLSFDAFGQLIGTTGRDGVPLPDHLFWIDKETGLADLETAIPLTAGGDYEAVDCLAQPPTAIDLIFFIAVEEDNGSVTLVWETGSEINNFGFNVYRSSTSAFSEAIRIHFEPSGTGSIGREYTFIDTPPQNSYIWYYWLGDVDGAGRERIHGPVQIIIVSNLYQTYLPLGFSAQP